MKILIVGAGIGGLTAALCLQKAGHDVTVFEKATGFTEVGAGIQCGANALRVMDYLGLLEQLEALSVEPDSVEFRDYKTGESIYSLQLGVGYREKYSAPYYHIHRSDLQGVLINALDQRAPKSIQLDAQIVSYSEATTGVHIDLADGRSYYGDCLIGADGVKSIVRDQLLGEQQPQFTGMVAWRGVVPSQRLPDNFMDKVASNFMGPNSHMVVYYLRKQQLINFVGVVDNPDWTNDSWMINSPWEELKADFTGWHSIVQALIDAVDKDHCFRWALYNHRPFSNWSSKRVTLLGDAAHSSLPFMASGAAMAIEDARVLQRALDQTNSVESALQLYQRNRFQRTARIQRSSTSLGKIYHLRSKLMLKAAFGLLNLVGGRQEAFLPAYDANTVELI